MSDVHQKLVQLAEGVLVEEDVLGIVDRIKHYDPNLIVQYCDPVKAEFSDAPYRIMEMCPDGFLRLVFEVWELDARVIDRIAAADSQRHNILADLDIGNQKVKEGEQRRYKDEVDALSEMVRDVLRSPKDTYTATNPVTEEDHEFRSLKKSND